MSERAYHVNVKLCVHACVYALYVFTYVYIKRST